MSLFRPSNADAWFSIGKLPVTTTIALIALNVAGTVASAFVPSLGGQAALTPGAIFGLQLWRLVTWPLVDGLSLWTVLTLIFFYMFGSMLESTLGKRATATFYLGLWAIITVSYLLAVLILPAATPVYGLALIQLLVLLLFIADTGRHITMFGMPAWVLGVIFVALQLLVRLQMRDFAGILALLLSLAGTAVWAKTLGLLSQYDRIPRLTSRPRKTRPRRARQRAAKPSLHVVGDEERLDQLLDKVRIGGLGSLTKKEHAELVKISKRRRR